MQRISHLSIFQTISKFQHEHFIDSKKDKGDSRVKSLRH